MKNSIKYSVTLSFEEIKLPPFEEILVLGKNSPQGKTGISKSFDLLIPIGFEIIDSIIAMWTAFLSVNGFWPKYQGRKYLRLKYFLMFHKRKL